MKTAAKVCIIIGMVFGFWMILPLVFGILALNKLNTATKKEELVGMGVCALLFCSTLGGIFMLCVTDEDLQSNVRFEQNQTEYVDNSNDGRYDDQNDQVTTVEQPQEQTNEISEQSPEMDNVELLARYKNLLDKGIISKKEYEEKKEEILKNCL